MGFFSSPSTPAVTTVDPVAEQAKIDAAATEKANASLADKKKNQRNSALATGAATSSDATTTSALAMGKLALGA